MATHRFAFAQAIILGLFLGCCSAELMAQQISDASAASAANSLEYKIRPGLQRVSMYVNSSKILTLEGKQIPRALVNNPELVNAIAISANQIQLSGLKAGVTQINLWDDDGELYTLDVIVSGDAKELELLLEHEFPDASLRVRPLASSVVISGWVDDPEVINRIVRVAEDYYPKVINNIRVGDNQQVQLHVQVMEVSRSKLRRLGIDWNIFGVDAFVGQSVSGLLAETMINTGQALGTGGSTITFGVADATNQFFAAIDALRQHDLVKILAEPVLTTVSGRPASFNAGGEFPILIPQGLGTVAIEYKTFGTRVDFVPIVLGNGNIRLEVRPQVSEVDNARGVDINGTRVPGLRSRWVDTACEMRAGQTLALAGLIQNRVETQNRGLPVLADIPWVGSLFRSTEDLQNEIELLVLVRPEFVAPMEPHEVPMFGPGEQTTSPSYKELMMRGYMEVPACCPDGSCLMCRAGRGQFARPNGRMSGQHSGAMHGMPMEGMPMEGMHGMHDVEIISDTPLVPGTSTAPLPGTESLLPQTGVNVPAVDAVPPIEAPTPVHGINFGADPLKMPYGMRPSAERSRPNESAVKSAGRTRPKLFSAKRLGRGNR